MCYECSERMYFSLVEMGVVEFDDLRNDFIMYGVDLCALLLQQNVLNCFVVLGGEDESRFVFIDK